MNYARPVLLLMALLATGCQVSPQPSGSIYHPAVIERTSDTEEAEGAVKVAPSRAVTVAPIKAKGVIDELRQQGNERLKQAQWREAIVIAERGLRVDRREAGFYWLLAQAYQGLDELGVAAAFAQQGLRYAPRSSGLYRDLQALLLAL